MRTSKGARYHLVAGLQRGLSVLTALNRAPQGMATAAEVSAATQLHRTTVKRLLETLCEQGYVRRGAGDEKYRLEWRVRELADGFTDDERVSSVAQPVMGELLAQVVWPSDLTIPDGDAMVVCETTHRFSPLSFHRNIVGRRMPMLLTATGRAYLSNCPDAERSQLLRVIATGDDEQSRLAASPGLVERLVKRTRKDGYGCNEGDWTVEPQVGAIALPIRREAKVVGCLNVIYLRRALTTAVAVDKFMPALRRAVERIERGIVETAPSDRPQA